VPLPETQRTPTQTEVKKKKKDPLHLEKVLLACLLVLKEEKGEKEMQHARGRRYGVWKEGGRRSRGDQSVSGCVCVTLVCL
jgi:hypothetical protein